MALIFRGVLGYHPTPLSTRWQTGLCLPYLLLNPSDMVQIDARIGAFHLHPSRR